MPLRKTRYWKNFPSQKWYSMMSPGFFLLSNFCPHLQSRSGKAGLSVRQLLRWDWLATLASPRSLIHRIQKSQTIQMSGDFLYGTSSCIGRSRLVNVASPLLYAHWQCASWVVEMEDMPPPCLRYLQAHCTNCTISSIQRQHPWFEKGRRSANT